VRLKERYTDRVTPDSPGHTEPALCLVGVGPRGTSVIERLAAIAHRDLPDAPWALHLVDDAPFGAGRIWRMDQTPELCMNTLCGAVTLFTDEATTVLGPIVPGPTLHEWCLLVRDTLDGTQEGTAVPAAHRSAFHETPLPHEFLARPHLVDEARRVRPESHPSRALYGAYITWCFEHALARLPAHVTVVPHQARAVAVEPDGRRERVILADGTQIAGDAVILSPGWIASEPPRTEATLREHASGRSDLVWVRQGSPVEQPLDTVPAGAPAIVRGLGMGFFDAMALLTVGRGGRFVEERDGLRYEPSGDEPVLHVTSRRGIPFHAKSQWGGLPPRAEQTYFRGFDPGVLDGPIDFERDLWPRIVQDAEAGWFRTLWAEDRTAFAGSLHDVLRLVDDAALVMDTGAFDDALSMVVPDACHRFHLFNAMVPGVSRWASPEAFDRWVVDSVQHDLAEAHRGPHSPLKRALWEVNAARKPTSKYMSFTTASAETHASAAHRRFVAFGAMIGSGPPAFRNAQLLALAAAGLVHFIGPDGRLGMDEAGFTCSSPVVAGSTVHARTLVDAFLNAHDARSSLDPVMVGLADRGIVSPHRRRSIAGGWVAASGLAVEPGTSRALGVDGRPSPRVHVVGIPVEDTRGDTVISPMPRVNATFLREADGVAASALRTLFPSYRSADQEVLHV
jgi:hypothetical protein